MSQGTQTTTVITKKRNAPSRRKRKARQTVKPKTIGKLIPQAANTMMRYQGNFLASPSAIQTSFTYAFRLNSIQDPDYSNVTKNKKVDGFTQANSLFNNYRVSSAIITLKAVNLHTSAAVQVVLTPSDDGITTDYPVSTYPSTLASRSGAVSMILGPLGSSKDNGKIVKQYKVKDIAGISQSQVRDDVAYSAAFTTNPAKQQYFAISVGYLPEGAGATGNVMIDVQIKYRCHLFNIDEKNTDE